MKNFTNFIFIGFISLLISFLLFFMVSLYLFIPKEFEDIDAQKIASAIPYSYSDTVKNVTFLLSIENCPVDFYISISSTPEDITVNHLQKSATHTNNYQKQISFDISGFENLVNYLGGVEIETPYGLPSPAKDKKIIAKDEKLLVYGVSLGEILTNETEPSAEKKDYYCYIIKKLCFKFINECTLDTYKFLKQNCETDISYAEFYDNYEALKNKTAPF